MKLLSSAICIAITCLLISASLKAQMPYTAQYSSKFEISDPKYSAVVLNAWKVYDDNSFDKMKMDIISDTIHAWFADGTMKNGKDSFMTSIKAYRSGFSSVKSDVIAYVSVKSIDKKNNLVFIWGSETDTKTDGTTQKVDLHEVWGFDKAGKVEFFKQFMATAPPEK